MVHTPAIPEELAHLPVAVIGAGPIGLAAAARLAERDMPFVVFEAGPRAGTNVLEWGHVHLFSPWSELIDPMAAQLLGEVGWAPPRSDEPLPSGAEYVDRYLAPLSAHPLLAAHIRYGTEVTSVHRRTHDKVKTPGRSTDPFVVRVEEHGRVETHLAAAVIDASGTWRNPNPAGAGGVAAPGEEALGDLITYRIPDVGGADRAAHAGRHTLVIGSGHSAVNAVLDLIALAESAPATRVTWAVRGSLSERVLGTLDDDRLPARERLGRHVREAVDAGRVTLVDGFAVERFEQVGDAIRAVSFDGRDLVVDRVVALTGQRPDLSLTRELRLDLDPWLEAPRALAPLIDPNVHTCGTVEPHGHETLSHPEPGYVAVGIKSYGRAPTFLTLTGFEQVRSVVAALAGDDVAARRIDLDLSRARAVAVPSATPPSASVTACCA